VRVTVPTLVLAVSDLMFAARIADAARADGWSVVTPSDTSAAREHVIERAAALAVDLQDPQFDARALLEAARDAGAPALAFGRHTDAASLKQARALGATAVPRSELVERLPELLTALRTADLVRP